MFRRACKTLIAAVLTAAGVFGIGINDASAQSVRTWTGGGDGLWSDNFDWSGGLLVRTVGDYTLLFGGTSRTANNNDLGTVNVGTLSFTNNGSAGQSAVFTLSGSALALTNSLITTTGASGLASNGDVINNRLSLTGSSTVSLASGHNLTIAGEISGVAATLTKNGDAALYLTGSNDFSGTTYINAGNVRTGSGGASSDSNSYAFGTSNIVVNNGGMLSVRNSSTVSNNVTISGTGATVGYSGGGPLMGSFGASNQTAVVSGTVTLAGSTSISTWGSKDGNGNTVTNNKLLLSGPVELGSNALTFTQCLTAGAITSTEVSGIIRGTGSVVVDGGVSVYLDAANSYSGGTTIASGTLHAGNAVALGSGALAVNGGTLDLGGVVLSVGTLSGSSTGVIRSLVGGNASLVVNQSGNATYAGSITNGDGVVGLTKNGDAALYLTGSNDFSGTTYINAGNVRTGSGGASSDSNSYAFGTSNIVVNNGGMLSVRNSSTVSNNVTISGTGATVGYSGGGPLMGSFGASNQTAVVSGTVTLAGSTSISTWGSKDGNGNTVTNNKLLLSGPVELGSNALTFTQCLTAGAITSTEVSGIIRGTGSVVVDGGASVYLNGANTYTGTTTVQSGLLGGSGTIAGTVVVENGTIAPGGSAGAIDTLTVGSLELGSGATAAFTISNLVSYDSIVSTGAVDFGSNGGSVTVDFLADGFAHLSVWQLFSGTSFTGNLSSFGITGAYGTPTFTYADGEWSADLGGGNSMHFYENDSHAIGDRYRAGQLVVVPEPSTIAIAGIGLLVLGWQRLAKRRRAARMSEDAIAAA